MDNTNWFCVLIFDESYGDEGIFGERTYKAKHIVTVEQKKIPSKTIAYRALKRKTNEGRYLPKFDALSDMFVWTDEMIKSCLDEVVNLKGYSVK